MVPTYVYRKIQGPPVRSAELTSCFQILTARGSNVGLCQVKSILEIFKSIERDTFLRNRQNDFTTKSRKRFCKILTCIPVNHRVLLSVPVVLVTFAFRHFQIKSSDFIKHVNFNAQQVCQTSSLAIGRFHWTTHKTYAIVSPSEIVLDHFFVNWVRPSTFKLLIRVKFIIPTLTKTTILESRVAYAVWNHFLHRSQFVIVGVEYFE